MRLVKVALSGLGRFSRAEIDVWPGVIAIVGPNEAGKSTLLQALLRTNDSNPWEPRFFSRHDPPSADQPIVELLYRLEPQDAEALSSLGVVGSRFLVVRKRANGAIDAEVIPPPPPTFTRRKRAAEAIEAFLARVDPGDERATGLDSLVKALRDSTGPLDTDSFLTLEFSEFKGLPELTAAIEAARTDTGDVSQEVLATLMRRRPRFLFFSDADRNLASEYDLGTQAESL